MIPLTGPKITYDTENGFKSATSDLNIGWLNLSSGYHYFGTLDEAAIYDRVLLDNEIWQHFSDGSSYCESTSPPPDIDGDGCLTVFFDRKWKLYRIEIVGKKEFLKVLQEKIVEGAKVKPNKLFIVRKSKYSASIYWGAKSDVYSILHRMYDGAVTSLPRKHEKAKIVMMELSD